MDFCKADIVRATGPTPTAAAGSSATALVLRFRRVDPSVEEINVYFETLAHYVNEVASEERPGALVFDASELDATAVELTFFWDHKRFNDAYLERMHRVLCAAGLVLGRSMVRGMISCLLRERPPPLPVRFFDAAPLARRWALDRVSWAHGGSLGSAPGEALGVCYTSDPSVEDLPVVVRSFLQTAAHWRTHEMSEVPDGPLEGSGVLGWLWGE